MYSHCLFTSSLVKPKIVWPILCGIFFFGNASAQKLVNTTGNTISNDKYIIEYSVGEISITTLTETANAGYVTQGLLQPNIKVINPACIVVNDTINFFPNPVEKILSVAGRLDWITSYRIYAADGKLVRIANFVSNQINMYNLPGGAYFIKLYPGCDNNYRVLKVIKQ
jgi:Secretion system C-terminal sorting domain